MDLSQILNGLALGSLYMILASGMAMIYGLRGVTNFGHGALYLVGAYLAFSVSTHSFWLGLIVAPLGLAVIGALLELLVFRRLSHRDHMEVGLLTFGIGMVLHRVVVLIWGERTQSVAPPAGFEGSIDILGTPYPAYRILVIGIAALLAAGLILWINKTRSGLYIRAASQDVETSGILGVNVDRMSLIVVAVGAALAGLAGALAGPYTSVYPDMDAAALITVLIIVVIGGVGSIAGAMVAGLVLGVVQTLGSTYVEGIASLIPYIALVLVLLWRPMGFAGKRV